MFSLQTTPKDCRGQEEKGVPFLLPSNDTKKNTLLQRGKGALQRLADLRSAVKKGTAGQAVILSTLDVVLADLPAFLEAFAEDDKLLTIEEAAAALNISTQALYGRIKRGTIPAAAICKSPSGKRYFIKRSALAEVILC